MQFARGVSLSTFTTPYGCFPTSSTLRTRKTRR
ncbi:hypothetical protein CURTO8I2_320057 [Curtobacterium sp. 8I-2]|nr:hypothetical protein CURTO8I2_320057 [Curtobacterium sp. 8I-2]